MDLISRNVDLLLVRKEQTEGSWAGIHASFTSSAVVDLKIHLTHIELSDINPR